jgi:hypothetical protein
VPDDLGDQIELIVVARKKLEVAAATVCREAAAATRLHLHGTDELLAAFTALDSATYLDEEEEAARWVARTYTATPKSLLCAGPTETDLALCGAVGMLRGALANLDELKQAGDRDIWARVMQSVARAGFSPP